MPPIAVDEWERSGRLRGTCRRLDPRFRGWSTPHLPAGCVLREQEARPEAIARLSRPLLWV